MDVFPSLHISGKPSFVVIDIIKDFLFDETIFIVYGLGCIEVVACFLGNFSRDSRTTEVFVVLVGV